MRPTFWNLHVSLKVRSTSKSIFSDTARCSYYLCFPDDNAIRVWLWFGSTPRMISYYPNKVQDPTPESFYGSPPKNQS